jgi:anti-sigma B factor antagonist
MKMTHENYDKVTVIAVNGEMTTDDVEPFKKLVGDRLAASSCDFVLDASKLEFVDSRGLETLLWLQDQAGERLGQVRLVQPTESVRTILKITRLEHTFDAHDSTEAALKSLR